MSRDEHVSSKLNGRADNARFAQNPLPVVQSIGRSLAEFHQRPTADLLPRTPHELASAIDALEHLPGMPAPFAGVSVATMRQALETGPPKERPSVCTHGAPVAARTLLVDGVAILEGSDDIGLDPAERDLAIALRSIAEVFSSEATRSFLDAYEAAGGDLPDSATLDWYALLAAFR